MVYLFFLFLSIKYTCKKLKIVDPATRIDIYFLLHPPLKKTTTTTKNNNKKQTKQSNNNSNNTHAHAQWGWSDLEKASCILRHRGVPLVLAHSWARPAILVAGKGSGVGGWGGYIFIFLLPSLSFLFFFLPYPLSVISLLSLLSLFSVSLADDTK